MQAPDRLEFDDGFADKNAEPVAETPVTHAVVPLDRVDGRTRMTTVSHFASADQLQNMVEMGMKEGMREALGQLDTLLTDRDDR